MENLYSERRVAARTRHSCTAASEYRVMDVHKPHIDKRDGTHVRQFFKPARTRAAAQSHDPWGQGTHAPIHDTRQNSTTTGEPLATDMAYDLVPKTRKLPLSQ